MVTKCELVVHYRQEAGPRNGLPAVGLKLSHLVDKLQVSVYGSCALMLYYAIGSIQGYYCWQLSRWRQQVPISTAQYNVTGS